MTEKFEEWYGTLMEKTTISGKENKNLQYLTNELFKAAKYDLREDAKHKKEEGHIPSTKGLDEFTNKFGEKLGVKKINKTSELYKELASNYTELKGELKNTRVLGVGKSDFEKTKTLGRNCLVSMGRVFGAVGAVSMVGAGLFVGFFSSGLLGESLLVGGANLASKSINISLKNKRVKLKNNIKKIVNADIISPPNSTPKKNVLKEEKIWKKDSGVKL